MTSMHTGQKALTAKGRATRERIVGAAATLMFTNGVARTSLDDVKASAGVSSSQLYHYFVDKHALVMAVISHQTEAVLDGQQPHLAALDSMAALRAWRDALVRFRRTRSCRGGCPIGSLASELTETDAAARVRLGTSFRQWEESIRNGLRAMHERGDLSPRADPDELALALLAAVQGGILLTQVYRDTKPMEAALDTMLAHIQSLVTPARSITASRGRARPASRRKLS
jgi:TetR/AcrR family transcriptional regulator, transcriptional repressor for nem operon